MCGREMVWRWTALAALAAWWASNSQAGVITGGSLTPPPGISVSVGAPVTLLAGDDDVALAGVNTITLLEVFSNPGMVDVVFTVSNNAPNILNGNQTTTEYLVTKEVTNLFNTGFQTFSMQLGTGTGAGFVQSAPNDGLDFDAPDFNSPVVLGPRLVDGTIASPGGLIVNPFVLQQDQLTWDTSAVLPGLVGVGVFTFAIDVPNGITTFTLRQVAAVPEPSTFWLTAVGSAAGVWWWSRRRGKPQGDSSDEPGPPMLGVA